MNVEVTLEGDGTNNVAIGAVVEYVLTDGSDGIAGVDERGTVDVIIPGNSESIVRLTASLPWQTSCGVGKGENDAELKLVYGTATINDEEFPVAARVTGDVAKRRLVLPKMDKIDFSVALEGTFPDVAMMSSNILAKQDQVVHLEDQV